MKVTSFPSVSRTSEPLGFTSLSYHYTKGSKETIVIISLLPILICFLRGRAQLSNDTLCVSLLDFRCDLKSLKSLTYSHLLLVLHLYLGILILSFNPKYYITTNQHNSHSLFVYCFNISVSRKRVFLLSICFV